MTPHARRGVASRVATAAGLAALACVGALAPGHAAVEATAPPVAKAVHLLDTRDRDRDGYADKRLLVDLLAIPDPRGLGGAPGGFFPLPFVTVEQLAVVDDHTIVVGNDNNFPGSAGRRPDRPDDNEYALIQVDEDLDLARRLL